MNKYLLRSLKYFAFLCIIYMLILYVMSFTSYLVAESPIEAINSLLRSPRGVRMVLAMAALALVHPWIGYVKREIDGSLVANRDTIIAVMEGNGFRLMSEEREGEMTFRADNFLRRLTLLFEDHIVMRQEGDSIMIAGNRKSVAYMIFRLEYAIKQESK